MLEPSLPLATATLSASRLKSIVVLLFCCLLLLLLSCYDDTCFKLSSNLRPSSYCEPLKPLARLTIASLPPCVSVPATFAFIALVSLAMPHSSCCSCWLEGLRDAENPICRRGGSRLQAQIRVLGSIDGVQGNAAAPHRFS